MKDQEINRMKDIEFCLLIITSVELGYYFTQDKELLETIKRFDDEYPNQDKMKDAVIKAITFINHLSFEYDSIWYKKTSMFSLITELAKYFLDKPDIELNLQVIEKKLIQLEETILKSKLEDPETNKYAKYYKHTFQQTTSRTGRIARALVIAEQFT